MARKTMDEKVAEIQRVVMYSRIGYSEGRVKDELRFALQEDAMQAFCDKHKLEVKSKYREIAVGTLDHWSRPTFEKALNDLKWSRKEKSVLLVSRMDRLSKNFGTVVRLMDDYNPKFLVAAYGLMRCDNFLCTVQTACAEEEFRVKYGKLYHTSQEGLQTFYNRHKFFTELSVKNGDTPEKIADKNRKYNLRLPAELEWSKELIENILKYGVDK